MAGSSAPAGTKLDTRARMVLSAIELLRERGAAGVSIDAVLARSGAPRGSVYHHFPGGRDELVLTAGQVAADYITHLITEATSGGDPRSAVEKFVAFWEQSLEATDYRAGCPVVALAVNSRDDLPAADELVRLTFEQWQTRLAAALEAKGATPARARAQATFAVAAIEGSIVMCRAERSAEPLRTVAAQLLAMY